MNLNLPFPSRRRVIVLATAALFALALSFAPVLLDGATGTSFTAATFACSVNSGGC